MQTNNKTGGFKLIKLNGYKVTTEKYPNGETRIELKELVPHSSPAYRISWKYESDAEFLTIAFIADYIRSVEDKRRILLALDIWYMPYSRMDRSENGSVFTLKTMCNLINSLNFDNVYVHEPHSSVTSDMLNNVLVMDEYELLRDVALFDLKEEYPDTPVFFFYPDKGAMNRYRDNRSSEEKIPYLYGSKKRDFETGRITSYEIVDTDVFGAMFGYGGQKINVVIVDDLTSYGGTFVEAAKKLREIGADKIYLAVAHAEKSAYKGVLFDHIDRLYTTNSIIDAPENDKTVMLDLSTRKFTN